MANVRHKPLSGRREAALTYRRLRVPREHGAMLVEPSLAEAPTLVQAAQQSRQQTKGYDLQGRSLADVAAQARAEAIEAAYRYTAEYRNVPRPGGAERVFLAGHQPQLFHPGVWFKNLALARLAREQQGVALNLVIDSDTPKSASLRIPCGTAQTPLTEMVPYDEPAAEAPYEDRPIQNPELFASFGRRAAEAIAALVPDPLLKRFWPMAVARSRHTNNLGDCLAQARHQLEGEWGLATLELPQRRVCELESFHWFVAHLLARLPRFWEIHNDALGEYRRLHGIRGRLHPVPDLAAEADWLEAPFWLWRAGDTRRRMFVRQRGDEIVLTDRAEIEIGLPLAPEVDAGRAVDVLAELPDRGIRLRTRALTTTLFARMFLGEVFLHGIGGAKYDQLTDLLMARFFQVEPPPFMVLSATLLLPIEHERITAETIRDIQRRLRELEFNPERTIASSESAAAPGDADWRRMARIKARWIATAATPENARERCQQIRRANEALQPWAEPERQRLLAERDRSLRLLRAEAVLSSREYAFCLYPEATLRDFLLAFLRAKP